MTRRLVDGPLVVASHNAGKIAEFRELLADFPFDMTSAAELDLPEPEETGDTYEANARLKALASARGSGKASLADDSGLSVDALDGAPGIYSARWAGPDRDFAMAMRNVEEALQQAGATDAPQRSARFVAVLCLAWPDGHTEEVRGEVAGTLVWPPRGTKGFGYDPMFRPDGHDRTFGEMVSEEKHAWSRDGKLGLSHRSRAFSALVEKCLGPDT
ncbi:MAG: RdgB/HAM1 family non-canonical purine NTP pyrophosphatase [Pseudomonadota bacterium]